MLEAVAAIGNGNAATTLPATTLPAATPAALAHVVRLIIIDIIMRTLYETQPSDGSNLFRRPQHTREHTTLFFCQNTALFRFEVFFRWP